MTQHLVTDMLMNLMAASLCVVLAGGVYREALAWIQRRMSEKIL